VRSQHYRKQRKQRETQKTKGNPAVSCLVMPSNASLPDELNAVYARFEASNTEPCVKTPAIPYDSVITL
jgi:hypothetical protein